MLRFRISSPYGAGSFLYLALAGTLLAGCSSSSSALSPLTASQSRSVRSLPAIASRPSVQPDCVSNVWVSTYGSNTVLGYTSGGALCRTITGRGPNSPFSVALELATDSQGYLYVTDIGNHRVVVFNSAGAYWSTLEVSPVPTAVCVGPSGVVAIIGHVPETQINYVSFFTDKGAFHSDSNASNGTGGQSVGPGCAFDKRGDFFTPGAPGIQYVRNTDVNTANAVLQVCGTALCTANWAGMYSHVQPGNVNTLSLFDQSAHDIVNLKVTLGGPHLLQFATWPTHPTTLTTNAGNICQLAPTSGQGNASRIYLTDCGSKVFRVTNVQTGGPIVLFKNVTSPFGIATEPTGQY